MSLFGRLDQYWMKWLEHRNQMDDCRILKQLWNYKPEGRRGVGLTSSSLSPCDRKKNVFGLILVEDDDDDENLKASVIFCKKVCKSRTFDKGQESLLFEIFISLYYLKQTAQAIIVEHINIFHLYQ